MRLQDILPPPNEILTLAPEDLAPLVLKYLKHASSTYLNRYNFTLQSSELGAYAGAQYKEVAQAMTEAWIVLEREGLIAPQPGQNDGWVFITRRGDALLNSNIDFRAYQRGHLLPASFLDPELVTKVRPLFLRGDYDTAVFSAFRELEIRVRATAGLPQDQIGVPLMRQAFHPETGPLTDKSRPMAEREATQHLFAGAIGLFKNPSSHRAVEYSPEEAADLIRFANYLTSWVGRIKP